MISSISLTVHSDCVAESNRILPRGDWGLISREGVKNYLCQGNPGLIALEKKRDSNRSDYKRQIAYESNALAMANRVSMLISTQRFTINKWSEVFAKCNEGRTELLKCVNEQEAAFVTVNQLSESSRLLLIDLDSLLSSDGTDGSAYYKKVLGSIRASLNAHHMKLKEIQNRIRMAGAGS